MGLEKAIKEVNEAIKYADEVAKKLTTKTRKKLPKSVFCGPNRSFPVNDCAHVRAAKAYLKRSKFSAATQRRIAACINRRAKELGCPGSTPAKAKGAKEDVELKKLMDSELFAATKKLVNQSLETSGLELDFDECNNCV